MTVRLQLKRKSVLVAEPRAARLVEERALRPAAAVIRMTGGAEPEVEKRVWLVA
jgi:hypothetical protein